MLKKQKETDEINFNFLEQNIQNVIISYVINRKNFHEIIYILFLVLSL